MKLEKRLENFIDEALEESITCTVEGSFSRMLTDEEISYINSLLNESGYEVNCFQCETCEEYSDGKRPFHIERILKR